jgi:hypothetical protein
LAPTTRPSPKPLRTVGRRDAAAASHVGDEHAVRLVDLLLCVLDLRLSSMGTRSEPMACSCLNLPAVTWRTLMPACVKLAGAVDQQTPRRRCDRARRRRRDDLVHLGDRVVGGAAARWLTTATIGFWSRIDRESRRQLVDAVDGATGRVRVDDDGLDLRVVDQLAQFGGEHLRDVPPLMACIRFTRWLITPYSGMTATMPDEPPPWPAAIAAASSSTVSTAVSPSPPETLAK